LEEEEEEEEEEEGPRNFLSRRWRSGVTRGFGWRKIGEKKQKQETIVKTETFFLFFFFQLFSST